MSTKCYSKEDDSHDSATFHSKCDGVGPTITIMKLSTGKIIGGYSDLSWASSGNNVASSNAYLFSITNDWQMTMISPGYSWALYHNSDYGPTWGGGHDLHVESDMNSGSCMAYYSYGFLQRTLSGCGTSYSSTCAIDFCGSYNAWTIDELEVWY